MSTRPPPPALDRQLVSVLSNAHFGAVVLEGERVAWINPVGRALIGYDEDELTDVRSMIERLVPDPVDRERLFGDFLQQQEGRASAALPVCIRARDGAVRHIEPSAPTIIDDGLMLVTFFDITDRVVSHEALARNEASLRALLENAQGFVVYSIRLSEGTHGGVVEYVSPSIREIMDVEDPARFDSWFERIHEEDRARVEAANAVSAARGEPFSEVMRIWHERKQEWRHIHAMSSPVRDTSGRITHFTGAIVDVTLERRDASERRKLEQVLLRAAQLEAMGTLAAGVAHDVNNVLTTIQGCVTVLSQEANGAERRQLIQDIGQSVRSGAELTRQLLGFARRGPSAVKTYDVNESVRRTVDIFRRTHRKITTEAALSSEPRWIDADPTQIERVLLNLFINAAEAMPDGGVLSVATGAVSDAELPEALPRLGADYTRIEVRDTGSGMDEATLERIFEPFFTTKGEGRGSGLGLAASDGIVRRHGGLLEVTSRVGLGTTFRIHFPPSQGQRLEPARDDRRLVLVVDDEPSVLRVVERSLASLNFRVACVSSGEAAVEFLARQGEDVSVVLLDMIMPGLSGPELFQRIREMRPTLSVVLCSAFAHAFDDLAGSNTFVLPKPFTFDQLSAALEAAIGAPPRLNATLQSQR